MRKKKSFTLNRNILLLRLAAILLPMSFAFAAVSQTAFAKTYVITDGDRVVTYTTFATDPQEVLDEIGLTLDRNDTYTTDGSAAIHISRAQTVSVSHYGEEMTVETGNETVGELLARLNYEWQDGDILSHPEDVPVYDGMKIRVDKVLTREETYTRTLHHETTYCADSSIPEGTTEVLIQARTGRSCTPPRYPTSTERKFPGKFSAKSRPLRR